MFRLRDRILSGPGGTERPLTPHEMLQFAAEVDLSKLELGEYESFRDEGYARNTVLRNDHLELVVIGWKAGQASTIHDHGESYCLYLVTGGTMTEEIYEAVENGRAQVVESRDWHRGDITLADGPTVHRVSNHTREDLVTVHLYSPPLRMPPRNYEAVAED